MSLRPDERQEAILGLKLIAAEAEMLVLKLEKAQTWNGDYSQGVSKIMRAVHDLPEER